MTQQHKHLIVRADIGWCPQEEDLNKISDWIRSLIKKIDMIKWVDPKLAKNYK